jgi:transmembrane sensor
MSTSPTKPTADQYEQASHWVSLLHNEAVTSQQLQGFQFWLARSPAHRQAYREVEAFWQQLGGLETLARPQLAAARVAVQHNQTQRRWLPKQSLAIAAAIVLLISAVPFVRLCLDNGNYRTAKGEQMHVQLSDGTHIDLNTDTEIQVSYSFFARKVSLDKGEALFTVKHDANKPFEVAAADGLIRDIGTQFNIYRQGDKVAVTVLEGEVSVSKHQANTPQTLTAGMQYSYSQDGQNQLADNGDIQDIASWREGKIVFKGQRLGSVLEQLARYHDVKLSAGNSSLSTLKVSGSFPTKDLNLALDTIAASLPVKITYQGAGHIVFVTSVKKK